MSIGLIGKLEFLLERQSIASVGSQLPLSQYSLRKIKQGIIPKVVFPRREIENAYRRQAYASLRKTGLSTALSSKFRSYSSTTVTKNIGLVDKYVKDFSGGAMKKWQTLDEGKGIYHDIEFYRERAEKAVRIGFSRSTKTWEEIISYPSFADIDDIEEYESGYEETGYWE